MVRGDRELIAGIATDPQFGRTVMLGVGGVLAEAVADVTLRLVPIERIDAEEMVDDLKAQALLGPFRGELPVDREVLVSVLLGLSRAARASLPYVYLGYWVEGSNRMAYKTGFRPLERLGRDGWRRMDRAELDSANEPLNLPTRRERKRLLIDA